MNRYKKYASSPSDSDEISDETSTTRLYAYDLAEVKAMCVDGKTKSDVIRELVRRALYARRYRQASTDPAFRKILKSFDDQVGVRLHHLERRLPRRSEADLGLMLSLVGYLYLAADFGLGELKQLRLLATPGAVSDEEFLKAWDERFEAAKGAVAASIRRKSERRRRRLEADEGGEDGGGGGDD